MAFDFYQFHPFQYKGSHQCTYNKLDCKNMAAREESKLKGEIELTREPGGERKERERDKRRNNFGPIRTLVSILFPQGKSHK